MIKALPLRVPSFLTNATAQECYGSRSYDLSRLFLNRYFRQELTIPTLAISGGVVGRDTVAESCSLVGLLGV